MSASTPANNYRLGLSMAILTGLSWGGLALLLKQANLFASSSTIVWVRFAIGFISLLIISSFRSKDRLKILKNPPLLGLLAGIGLAINYFGFMKGIEYTTPINTQIVIQIAPMGLILVGFFGFREPMRWYQWTGVALAALGFYIFYQAKLESSQASFLQYDEGNAWIFISALGWVLFASLQKILNRQWLPSDINLLVFGTATVVLYPWLQPSELEPLGLFQWLLLALLGAITVVAYGSLGIALKNIPSSHVSVIISTNPLITIALTAWAVHMDFEWGKNDPLTLQGYIGSLIVICGVVITVARRPAKKAK